MDLIGKTLGQYQITEPLGQGCRTGWAGRWT
jgi:hypothetical protein